jgi:signal transduction histidine kinase/ligand-binding sensor domain-containing protein
MLFNHYSAEDGLINSTVYDIFRDNNGFMWFATDGGVSKFDGYEFINYYKEFGNKQSLISSYIVKIFEDSEGYLWFGSGYQGLCYLNRKTNQFTNFSNRDSLQNGLKSNFIRDFFEDSENNLWIATSGKGVCIFDRNLQKFIPFNQFKGSKNELGSRYISSIKSDTKGNIWFGSTEGILSSYNVNDSTFRNYRIFTTPLNSRHHAVSYDIAVDKNNNIWYGSEEGLYFFNSTNYSIDKYIDGFFNDNSKNIVITSLEFLNDSILLIGVDHGGLKIININSHKLSTRIHDPLDLLSISNNEVYDIYVSKEKQVWIGNYKGGINFYDAEQLKFKQLKYIVAPEYRKMFQGCVEAICEDSYGNIWIGLNGDNGITLYNPKESSVKYLFENTPYFSFFSKLTVTSMMKHSSGDIYISTYNEGLIVVSKDRKNFIQYLPEASNSKSIGSRNTRGLAEDCYGNVWIGTMGQGVNYLNVKEKKFTQFYDLALSKYTLGCKDIFSIFIDSKNRVWIGSRVSLTLADLKNSYYQEFLPEDSIHSINGDWVFDILEDNYQTIWVTTNRGLNKFDEKNKCFINYQNRLNNFSTSYYCILNDSLNNLWISTNKGICKFSPSDNSFLQYDIYSGLQGQVFNYQSKLKDHNGNFYFGGINGTNVFKPSEIYINKNMPKTFLTGLKLANIDIDNISNPDIISTNINFAKTIKIKYTKKAITFVFAAINYTNSRKNEYRYILKGYDEKWINNGNKREATFTNLKPGKYTFVVQGSNNDGVYDNEGARVDLVIIPPFYKTWWFRIIEILIFGLLLYIFIKIRLYSLGKDKLILQEKVMERTHIIEEQKVELEQHKANLEETVLRRTYELSLAKEKAEESDRLKSSFLANMSHEIRTPLNAIVGFSTLMTDNALNPEERAEMSKIITSNSNYLTDFLDDIIDFSLLETGQLEIFKERFNIADLIENCIQFFASKNTNTQIVFYTDINFPEAFTINNDKAKIRKVINHLLSNALKFTSSGYIKIGAFIQGKSLFIYVEDTGLGIETADLKYIFDRFRKNYIGKTTDERGVGIGLSIVSRLVKLLGGKIYVQSAVNEGSTFAITFPIKLLDLKINELNSEGISYKHTNLKNKKILIIDDDKYNLLFIDVLLENYGIKSSNVKTLQEAIEILRSDESIDIILVDVNIKSIIDSDFLKDIKAYKANLPVIVLSKLDQPDIELNFKKLGFDDFMQKPIVISQFRELLQKYL